MMMIDVTTENSAEMLGVLREIRDVMQASCTGKGFDDQRYGELREALLLNPATRNSVPSFVRDCGDLDDFRSFIYDAPIYEDGAGIWAQRRRFLRKEFLAAQNRLVATLDASSGGECPTCAGLAVVRPYIDAEVAKALLRADADPDGSITASKSMLESLLKHLEVELGLASDAKMKFQTRYRRVAEKLAMLPAQHEPEQFRKACGAMATLVDSVAQIGNQLGDSHGRGPSRALPTTRHSRLILGVSLSLATYLVERLNDLRTANEQQPAGKMPAACER